jgi:hypothetical protein
MLVGSTWQASCHALSASGPTLQHAGVCSIQKPMQPALVTQGAAQQCHCHRIHGRADACLQTLDSSDLLLVSQPPSVRQSQCWRRMLGAPVPCPAPPKRARTRAHCPALRPPRLLSPAVSLAARQDMSTSRQQANPNPMLTPWSCVHA